MNLSNEQIDAVVAWMNTWEQLKDTVIPIRFKEDFIKYAAESPEMYFSYIEAGDNFVPDPMTDPYRRIPIKYGVTLPQRASKEDAEGKIKTAIQEYIQKNTVYPEHSHIQEKYISEDQLPVIRYD